MQHLNPQASQNLLPYSRPVSPRPYPLQIGFVGLGNMGYFIARNLAKHNASHSGDFLPLVVWNRSSAKVESLINEVGSDKARAAKDLDEVAQQCDIIITSLANDEVVKSVYQQFAKSLTVCFIYDLIFLSERYSIGTCSSQEQDIRRDEHGPYPFLLHAQSVLNFCILQSDIPQSFR